MCILLFIYNTLICYIRKQAAKYQSKELQRYIQVKELEEKLAATRKKNALKTASYKTKKNDLRENSRIH